MNNPTNAQLAGYLREWAKEMAPLEAGKQWLLLAADRLRDAVCEHCGSQARYNLAPTNCKACGRKHE